MRKKKYKWHYLVNVGIHGINNPDFGKAFVDTFYEFDNSKLNEYLMEQTLKNVLTAQEKKETNFKLNVSPEFGGVAMVTQYRERSHDFTTCVFHSNFRWTREDLEMYLKTQTTEELRKILSQSSIHHKREEV